MNRKQLILVIGSFAAVFVLIFASAVLQDPEGDDDKVKVVATFYPLAYMAESIGGDRVSVSSMVPFNTSCTPGNPPRRTSSGRTTPRSSSTTAVRPTVGWWMTCSRRSTMPGR
jgi:hypothetical protein